VSVLSTEAPAACLPKGALLNPVTGYILIAPEAVWEGDFVFPTPLAKYSAFFQIVFSFFDIRWTLGSENTWDLIITGRNKESGGEGGCVARRCCWRQVQTALEARHRSTTSKSASAWVSFFSNSRRCLFVLEIILCRPRNRWTSARTPGSLRLTNAVSTIRQERWAG